MPDFTTADFIRLSNLAASEEPTYEQKAADAARRLPFRLYKHSLAMGREVLSSPVFTIRQGERRLQFLDVTMTTARKGTIRYRGEELRQSDLRVLEFLVHEFRGRFIDNALTIDPMEFCEELGWGRRKREVEKLHASILRMQSSVLVVQNARGFGYSAQLVGAFDFSEPRRWTVSLHTKIVDLFVGGTTYFPLKQRKQLEDGLQSWLAGFLYANDDEIAFDLAELRQLSGSASERDRVFGRLVRVAMDKLKDVGVVSEFKFTRGRLHVTRDSTGAACMTTAETSNRTARRAKRA